MRNMSFMLTPQQIRSRDKWVTRRAGWWHLQPGDTIRAVEKAMGLRAGEKITPLAILRVASVRAELLRAMIDDAEYGVDECVKEGFGDDPLLHVPANFVEFFCESHKGCSPDSVINRIEFEYIEI